MGILTRRDFLRRSALSAAALFVPPFPFLPEEKLGRLTVGMVELKQRPDPESPTVGTIYEDAVLPWLREVVGRRPFRQNQR